MQPRHAPDDAPGPGPEAFQSSPQREDAGPQAPPREALPSLRLLLIELQATVQALAALAHSELQLSLALMARAALLFSLGLLMLGISVLLGAALLVSVALALGLSWPAALATSLGVLVVGAGLCALRASHHLRNCGLPRTRAQLVALLPETSP